jgi:GntR family transcriptional regulator
MKYQNIEKELVELLNSDSAAFPHGRFYSERELSEKYGVSRNTAHRAIAELCKQGYLVQIHGSGTFVKSSQKTQSLYSVTKCAQSYSELGMHPVRSVVLQQVTTASKTTALNLEIPTGSPVLELDIIYQANRMILNETVSYLPISRFPGVEKLNFTVSPLLEILRAKYGAHAKKTENALQAIHPTARIAENLCISEDTPILLFECVTSGMLDNCLVPFEYFKCYYKTDFFRFSFIQSHDTVY